MRTRRSEVESNSWSTENKVRYTYKGELQLMGMTDIILRQRPKEEMRCKLFAMKGGHHMKFYYIYTNKKHICMNDIEIC